MIISDLEQRYVEHQHHTVIIEKDSHLGTLIQDYLQQRGYLPKYARRGDCSVDIFTHGKPALVVLDLVPPPGQYRLTILQEFQSKNDRTILILKPLKNANDKGTKFIVGPDDKEEISAEPKGVLSNIHELLKHFAKSIESTPISFFEKSANLIQFGDLIIHPKSRRVTVGEKNIELTAGEFDLLLLFALRVGVVLDRDTIFRALRGFEHDGSDRSIDALVSRLRKKIEINPSSPKHIKTVRGKGYLFVEDVFYD